MYKAEQQGGVTCNWARRLGDNDGVYRPKRAVISQRPWLGDRIKRTIRIALAVG